MTTPDRPTPDDVLRLMRRLPPADPAHLAADHFLRGADAVYAAVAQQ